MNLIIPIHHSLTHSPYTHYYSRKELQHMLHNRRKAEIEILSASHATTSSFSQAPDRECLLVRYLTSKILKAIESSAEKAV